MRSSQRSLESRLRSPSVFETQATTELRHAHWSTDERTRRLLPNGALLWASEDGVAQFELPHHRRFFRVTIPVALPEEPERVGGRDRSALAPAVRGGWLSPNGFYMKTVAQTHLSDECPERWRELLLAACALPPRGGWTVELPTAVVSDAHPAPTEAAPLQRFLAGVSLLPQSSETARLGSPAPALCWTPTATVHFLPSEEEVEVVMSDGAALISNHRGSLFTYFFASGTADGGLPSGTPLQFAVEAVMGVALPSLGAKGATTVAGATTLAAGFAAAATRDMREAEAAGIFRPAPNHGAGGASGPGEVVEVVEVAASGPAAADEHSEAGRYTSFSDGSVHIAFHDRTQISLRSPASTLPGHARAQILLPDGSKKSHPLVAAPRTGLLGYGDGDGRLAVHLAAAVQFQEWQLHKQHGAVCVFPRRFLTDCVCLQGGSEPGGED